MLFHLPAASSFTMRYLVLAAAIFLTAPGARAAPLPPAARAEIGALLTSLERSGCEFNRNGSWHSGSEAKTHLLRKLQYLEDKDAVSTTEQFIERGASTSSSTGKPYLVRCPGAAPIESKQWLMARLATVRASAGK